MNLKKLFALLAVAFSMQAADAGYYRNSVYVEPTPVYVGAGEIYDDYDDNVGVEAGVDGVAGGGVYVGDGIGADVGVGPIGVGIGLW